jgi:hypothetical protein
LEAATQSQDVLPSCARLLLGVAKHLTRQKYNSVGKDIRKDKISLDSRLREYL